VKALFPSQSSTGRSRLLATQTDAPAAAVLLPTVVHRADYGVEPICGRRNFERNIAQRMLGLPW